MDIQTKISSVSIAFMIISGLFTILTPIGGIVYLSKKKKLDIKAFLWGMLLFFVFAMILENIMHSFVLGKNIKDSYLLKYPFFYVIYAGLAAGIFEETARYVGLKFILKIKEDSQIGVGLSYGLGHGGIEALLIGGMAIINNIYISIMHNNGLITTMTKNLPQNQIESFNKAVEQLVSMHPSVFLMVGLERVCALIIQIALTMYVYKAVKESKWKYYVIAILLHACVNIAPALYQVSILKNIYILELIVFIMTICLVYFSKKIIMVDNKKIL